MWLRSIMPLALALWVAVGVDRAQAQTEDEAVPAPPDAVGSPPGRGTIPVARVTLSGQSERGAQLGVDLALDSRARTLIAARARGGVLVFHRSADVWSVGDAFHPSSAGRTAVLSVAIDGAGTLAVAGFDRGHVSVLSISGRRVAELQALTPDGAPDSGGFGASVAVSGDGAWIVVGAPRRRGRVAGAVFVFRRQGERWRRVGVLVSPLADPEDGFGARVVLSADASRIVVAAPRAAFAADRSGAAFVFAREGDRFVHVQSLVHRDGEDGADFGRSLALSAAGTTLVVGAPMQDVAEARDAGEAVVFEASDSCGFRAVQVLRPSVEEIGRGVRNLGRAVAIGGDRVAVARRGAAPLVVELGSEVAPFALESVRRIDDALGTSVVLSGDGSLVFVGAPHDESRGVWRAGGVDVHEIATDGDAARIRASRPALEERSLETVRRAAARERDLHERIALQATLGVVLVGVTTASMLGFRAELRSPSACSGFFCVDATHVLSAVSLIVLPLAMSALAIGGIGALGTSARGRARRVDSFLGYVVGAVPGAGIVALIALLDRGAVSHDEGEALLGGGIALAGLLAVGGAILASAISDDSIQAPHDVPDLVPLVQLGHEHVILGLGGAL